MELIFNNRKDTARRLAEELTDSELDQLVVLGIPPGGVEVAMEVGRLLHVHVDILVIHELRSPNKPDHILGAVGPEGVIVLDRAAMERDQVTDDDIDQVIAQERIEMKRISRRFRDEADILDLRDRRTVIASDIMTSTTVALAAIRTVRSMDCTSVILATGVCTPDFEDAVAKNVDSFICLATADSKESAIQRFKHFEEYSIDELVEMFSAVWSG